MTTPNTSLKGIGPVALVGAGKMGGAMLEGWLALGLESAQALVIDPAPSPEISVLAGRGVVINPPRHPTPKAQVVVVAVKPQVATMVLPNVAPLVGDDTVIVSVMAGKTLAFLEAALPGAAIVRAMPNTPAAIGRGITVAVANKKVTTAQKKLAHDLLAATGAVEWIDDEALMDAVTAVSGSGPAYIFHLTEALAKAGVVAGLPPQLAETLARATVAGSGELLHRSPHHPAILRQNVTSPGGTTAAALNVLMAPDGLEALMTRAVEAATKRSRELAG
ncbi:MAG: pyrroline-5-carboxylate reductase [Pseudorhodoplanes sp.]|jgi:pyrroline-5-carboxylate reductase|nr:pyrroline-5-carboxylate reductase [Pseudorhodoplanes sp.]